MRILHCLDTINPAFGGPVEATRQFTRQSGRDGVEMEVLTLDSDISKWEHAWNVPVHCVPGARTAYAYTPHLVPWLRAHAQQYDAVVVHGIYKYHAVGVAAGLRGTGVPYFVIPHGMMNPWLKQAYPLKHLKKAIFWHTVIHRSLQQAAAVLFLCEEERALAEQTFRIRKCQEELVPLGIAAPEVGSDADVEAFLEKFPSLRGTRNILFLGRICLMKGCDLLLEAFARTADMDTAARLVMAGPDEDSWQAELMQKAARLGVDDRVVWTGPLYGNLKLGALRTADLFALPSHCETFPVAILEALAASVPVLTTDKVNIWKPIAEAGAGVFGADTLEDTTQSLAKWLQSSAQERTAVKMRARECFEKSFDIKHALRKHITVYQKYAAREAGQSVKAA